LCTSPHITNILSQIVGLAAEDIVLFVGNGTTAAVSKLIDALGLNFTWPEVFAPSFHIKAFPLIRG